MENKKNLYKTLESMNYKIDKGFKDYIDKNYEPGKVLICDGNNFDIIDKKDLPKDTVFILPRDDGYFVAGHNPQVVEYEFEENMDYDIARGLIADMILSQRINPTNDNQQKEQYADLQKTQNDNIFGDMMNMNIVELSLISKKGKEQTNKIQKDIQQEKEQEKTADNLIIFNFAHRRRLIVQKIMEQLSMILKYNSVFVGNQKTIIANSIGDLKNLDKVILLSSDNFKPHTFAIRNGLDEIEEQKKQKMSMRA